MLKDNAYFSRVRMGLRISVFSLWMILSSSVKADNPSTFPGAELHYELTSNQEAIYPREEEIEFAYKVQCDSEKPEVFPGIRGSLVWNGLTLRFELFSDTDKIRVSLGEVSSEGQALELHLEESPNCALSSLHLSHGESEPLSLSPLARLAKHHSPVLGIRDDQYANPDTDLPLALAFSWLPGRKLGTEVLKYTLIFTDEDSPSDTGGTEGQRARYGRATDIEWIYEVEFSAADLEAYQKGTRSIESLIPLARRFHSPLFGLVGHSISPFHGKFWGRTQHPILFNLTLNNVFGDGPRSVKQKAEVIGHSLISGHEISTPEAREVVMLKNPWMFQVSDRELWREKKYTHPFSDYLYVLIDGKLSHPIRAEVRLKSGETALSGGGHSNLDRLGEDLYLRQSLTALPFGSAVLKTIDQTNPGQLRFLEENGIKLNSPPRYYRFVMNPTSGEPVLEDISPFFVHQP